MITDEYIEEVKAAGSPEQKAVMSRYFKTGKGEYGEGDVFIGLKTPETVALVKKFWNKVSMCDLATLITSKYHEIRMGALLMLLEKYKFFKKKKDEASMQECVDFYLSNTKYINNWDLVDVTCYKLLGDWLKGRDRSILYKFANSGFIWEERISIVTCIEFVRRGDLEDALTISKMLLSNRNDLMHKAVGWTLREVGKIDKKRLDAFLEENYYDIPRTTLRYAIEKHPEEERIKWLKK